MSTSTSGRGRPIGRDPLSREQVLHAALTVIDRDGLEGLSMRKLGAELGVEAMSLYNHVANKSDALDGVVGLLWREVESHMVTDGPWQQQTRAFAAAVRHVAHAHPEAYALVLTRGVLPDEVLRVGQQLLAALQEAGFAELAVEAMLTLASHATAQALAEVAWRGDRAAETAGADAVAWPPAVGVAQQLPQHVRSTPFALGLELLIEALEARLVSAEPSSG